MTETLPKGMSNFRETKYDDGSGYKASFKYYGRVWYFDYTAGRASVRGTFSQYESQRGWKNENARKVLTQFLNDRLASFGEEWNRNHLEIYKHIIAAQDHYKSLSSKPDFMNHIPKYEVVAEYVKTVAPEGANLEDWTQTIFYATR